MVIWLKNAGQDQFFKSEESLNDYSYLDRLGQIINSIESLMLTQIIQKYLIVHENHSKSYRMKTQKILK